MLRGLGGEEKSSYDVTLAFICLAFSCQRPGRFYYFPIVYSPSFRVHAAPD